MVEVSNPHEVAGAETKDGGPGAEYQRSGESAAEKPCFVVAIGASAGGQGPLEHIFTVIPADCDLSFIVAVHQPTAGPSLLPGILGRYTAMPVFTAEEGMPLCRDTVHVLPPGKLLTLKDGRLRIESCSGPAGMNHPIDRLFHSIAAECGERAIAVVLSGYGTDGAEGVKIIKERGGRVLVQEPLSAVNPGMPQSAIATGAADMVLPMEDIPEKIAGIARGHCSIVPRGCLTTTLEEELQAIFAVVKGRTGHDFSSYKRNTVLRRIERRMTLNETGGIRKYITLLEESPQEAQALCQEFLIGVTGFFRDPDAFRVIGSEIIPRLFIDRAPEDPVRIWHACCSTGEEAYSVAIIIREYLERERVNARVQLFATDIDEGAVALARSGIYPGEIGEDVGEERLKAFFSRSDGRWQVAKRLREMIVFAHHNIIKDPPFSRLDLLVCRNFLIYLNPDMQKRLISLFHLVLKPGGILFLGASETVGHNSELFTPLDKKWKIFRRMESVRRGDALFPFAPPVRRFTRTSPPKHPPDSQEPSPGSLAERLLMERYAPPCVVVNEKFEAVHTSTRTGRYLELPVGEPTIDILRMAREELRPALRAAIYKSFTEQRQVAFRGVKVGIDEVETAVNVLVEPLAVDSSYGKLAMVILEPAPMRTEFPLNHDKESFPVDESSKEMLIRQLEEQLRITHEQLHATIEQLETSNEGFMSANEELMSINEEYQSTNEELHSSNEELETSREELQALNEELTTVNAELQGKVEELNQVNSDMENLFASSGIAAIFLDRNLIIKRFSPAMAAILNLIPADIGRPFRLPGGTIDWAEFPRDANSVLENLETVEREVSTLEDGRSFLMRVLPYWTRDGRVDGIVVTLVDISGLKEAEEATRSVALFPEENPSPVLRVARDGRLLYANRAADTLLGQWQSAGEDRLPDFIQRVVTTALDNSMNREMEMLCGERLFSFMLVPISRLGYVNFYGSDITERKTAEDKVRAGKKEWERTFDSVPDLIAIMDKEHRIIRVNRAMAERLGTDPAHCIGKNCFHSVHGTDKPPAFCPHVMTMADGREHAAELREDNLGGDFLVTTSPLLDENGRSIGSVHVARDISERKRAEEALQESRNRYRELVQNANSAIIRWKRDGTIIFFNEFAQKFFGYKLEEVLGKNAGILLPEGEPSGVDPTGLLKEIVEHPERFVNNVNENVLHDGRRVWMAWTNRPILDEQGQVAEVLAVGIDITERKLAEDALRASNEELERFNRATVGREMRMIELKREVNELCGRVGVTPRYDLDFADE
jgi:two-component system, chemotaxis family, CheB/CheR fusion protein